MLKPVLPTNEVARLAALHALRVLDTGAEERFDRLTRLARRLFDVPIAVVSLVDRDRQWFKSRMGLSVSETPRDISFCADAILGNGLFVVEDARADARFRDNPLVTGKPGVRFYAGCPLSIGDALRVGAFCLIDTKPRTLDDDERALLFDLGKMAEQELTALQLATTDELTGLSNRRGFEVLSQYALQVCKRMGQNASVFFFDMNGFKQINDAFGHAEGDDAIIAFAKTLRDALRESDVIGRLGGDEFVALAVDVDADEEAIILERLRLGIDCINRERQRGYALRYSVGRALYEPAGSPSIGELLIRADQAMYADKRASAHHAQHAQHAQQ